MLSEHLRRAAAAAHAQAAALEAAADELEARVDDSAPYTSLQLPPDCPSRERFRRLAAIIRREQGEDAAHRIGQIWCVERDAWATHRGAAPTVKATEPHVDDELDEVDAVEALSRAGLRVVGSPKR